jgi:hypothetical protein
VGIYTWLGELLGQVTPATVATAFTSTGRKVFSPVPETGKDLVVHGGPGAYCYVAVLSTGTTRPAFAGAASAAGAGALDLYNQGLDANSYRVAQFSSTSLPASLTFPLTKSANAFWVGLLTGLTQN